MLNKVFYIPLIMALLGLQTARGQESIESQEISNSVVITTVMGTNIPSDLRSGIDKTPQAARCDWYNLTGSTNMNGIAEISINGGYFTNNPVCSSLHVESPHHVNAQLQWSNGRVQVRTWTPSGQQAGPIWFSCMISICWL